MRMTAARRTFHGLAEDFGRLVGIEPAPHDVHDERLQLVFRSAEGHVELIHQDSDDSFVLHTYLVEGAALPAPALVLALRASWTLGCVHMPKVALSAAGDALLIAFHQDLADADAAQLAATWKALASLRPGFAATAGASDAKEAP